MKKLAICIIFLASIAAFARKYTVPEPLCPGDKIALVTPASAVDSAVVLNAADSLRALGYEPVIFPHALGKEFGSYAATDADRAADLVAAFADPEIKAVMCTRGGYGTNRLLEQIDIDAIKHNPKWLVGYSDISVLHALMHKAGVVSVHGPMCGHIASHALADTSTTLLFGILSGEKPLKYHIPATPYNKPGHAKGHLVGGNFLVLSGLAETPWDVLNLGDDEDVVIFIEDVGEQIYAIERMLIRLHQSGALGKAKGLAIGEFTNYQPDDDFNTMEDMIQYWLRSWGYYNRPDYPIVFGVPSGHGEPNFPLPISAETEVVVTPDGEASLSFKL